MRCVKNFETLSTVVAFLNEPFKQRFKVTGRSGLLASYGLAGKANGIYKPAASMG